MASSTRRLPRIKAYNLDRCKAAPVPDTSQHTRATGVTTGSCQLAVPARSILDTQCGPQSLTYLRSSAAPTAPPPLSLPLRPKDPGPNPPDIVTVNRRPSLWAWVADHFSSAAQVAEGFRTAFVAWLVLYMALTWSPLGSRGTPGVRGILDGAESELSVHLAPFTQSLQVASGHLVGWVELEGERARVEGLRHRVHSYQGQQRDLMNHYRQLYSTTLQKARSAGDCRPLIYQLRDINSTTSLLTSQHVSINLTLKGVVEDFRMRSNAAYDAKKVWQELIYEAYASIRSTRAAFHTEPYTASQQLVLGIIEQLETQCTSTRPKYFVAWSPEQMLNKRVIDGLLPRLDGNVRRLLER
ncbi:hypothetical protein AYL99_05184 [Fonsecaea erecta]|uniref:Uncharacterized protein n=1 Tax=Fonsecaea erecta TaxID=1367422 RepID=A0A178ZKI9_9EURO|nr:hypothetical protein AYL99_05184 [Fonsecaea erecta]OAP60182.1 hypothetical protein AYL99_05184 [Fonsecaea erecta]